MSKLFLWNDAIGHVIVVFQRIYFILYIIVELAEEVKKRL